MNARKVAEGVVPGFSEGPRSSRTVHSAALHAWLPPDAGSLLPAHLSRCSGPLISACSARRKNSSGRVRGAAASLPSCGTRKLPRLLGAAPLLPPTPKWPGCSCCSSEPCTASVTPRRRQGKPTCSRWQRRGAQLARLAAQQALEGQTAACARRSPLPSRQQRARRWQRACRRSWGCLLYCSHRWHHFRRLHR